MMDLDRAKLFVGGISRETTEEALAAHFSKYGTVSGSLVAKEKFTQNPRGFGFVWFSDPSFADKALKDSHVILGRMVEVKKAIPKSERLLNHQHQHHQKNPRNSNDCFRTKKIFVGGLSSSLTEEQFKNYFLKFGEIVDVVVMQDSSTNRPRGFGFVTFDSEESADKVMLNSFHELDGRLVEVKKAVPKEGFNGAKNSYITKGSIRGPSTRSFHPENYIPYGHGSEILPGYVPFHWYSGVGSWIYGGYPSLGYGRPDNGITAITPRDPWSSPVMIGPTMCPLPYSSPFIYPSYTSGYVSIIGMIPSGINGIVGPSEDGKLTKNCGVDGHQQYDGAVIPIEDGSSGIESLQGEQ